MSEALQAMMFELAELRARVAKLKTAAATQGMDAAVLLRLDGAEHELESVETLTRMEWRKYNK